MTSSARRTRWAIRRRRERLSRRRSRRAGPGSVTSQVDAAPARFRSPPKRRFYPRPASVQTDDLVIIYREVVASRATRRKA